MPTAKKATGPLRITRVKRSRKSIFIAWTVNDEEHDLTSRDNPLPAFTKALDALAPLVCTICHLPREYVVGLQANGVYVTEQGDIDAVTIVAVKTLPDNNRPLNIATPLKLMDQPETPQAANPPLTEKQASLIDEVLDEAKRYVKGERAQGQLELEPAKAPAGDDEKQQTLPGVSPRR